MKIDIFEGVDNDDRARLWIVSLVAVAVIALEIVAFQALNYVNEYMPATQVISVALMGIALGGLLSFFFGKKNPDKVISVVLVLLPLAILACFPVIIRLNHVPLLMMAMMTLPFVLASLLISIMFNTLRPSLVYLFDLAGAGVGALLAVFLIPLLREEGSFFFLTLLGSAPLFVHWRLLRRRGGGEATLASAVVVAAIGLGLVVTHVAADPFNMIVVARADEEEYPHKVFNFIEDEEGMRYDVLYSRGSLIERIDILQKLRPKRRSMLNSLYNGRFVDVTTSNVIERKGGLDTRLPTRLKLGEDPDTLLVGPSAQGLTKAVQGLGDGHIDAVEINGAVASLMMNELWKRTGRAYDGMNVVVGDVRTFLERVDREYDFITLLNTHRIYSIAHQGPPEYCHTIEAMISYIDHLTEDGFAVFEERNVNDRAELGIRRVVRTAMSALAARGAERPADHIAIYEMFDRCRKRVWFSDRSKCRRGGLYTFVLVKRSPISDEERAHLTGEWSDALAARGKPGGRRHRGIEWMYVPRDPPDSKWTRTVLAEDIYENDDVETAVHNMDLITDDRPFPYDVFLAREKPWEIFRTTAVMAFAMVLLPALIAFFARRREGAVDAPTPRRVANNLLLIGCFAVLGLGYLLLEIVLMQKLQIFLSSPIHALVVVLAGMLVFSGAGGYVSSRIGKRGAVIAVICVAALAGLASLRLSDVLDVAITLPLPLRVVLVLAMIGPLGFAMGMPFPFGLRVAKQTLGRRHAGLFFGLNGAVAALATPLSIVCSMEYGFDVTLLVGGAAYLLCALFLLPLWTGRIAKSRW